MTSDTHCGGCNTPRPTTPKKHCPAPTCTWWTCTCGITNDRHGNNTRFKWSREP